MSAYDLALDVRAASYDTAGSDFRPLKVGVIVLLHALVFYALMHDKVQARIERVIKAEIITLNLSEPTEPTRSEPARATPVVKQLSKPSPLSAAMPNEPSPSPLPLAEVRPATPIESSATSREASTTVGQSVAVSSATATNVVTTKEPPLPQPAQPRIELPSSNADYLNNPAPPYPAQSKRLGEQGKVLIHVFVSASGVPEKVELRQSSGFDRLDQIALETVKRWKFVPGKRNGAPEPMWVNVPMVFELT